MGATRAGFAIRTARNVVYDGLRRQQVESLPHLFLLNDDMTLHARVDLVFPAPNTAWTTGRIADFVQPTVSGDPESGLFGCVRSSGYGPPGWVRLQR